MMPLTPPNRGDIQGLISKMDSLSGTIEHHSGVISNVKKSIDTVDKRSTRTRNVGVLCFLLAMVVAGGALWVGARANRTGDQALKVAQDVRVLTDEIVSVRDENRISGCIRDNIQIEGQRTAIKEATIAGITTFAVDPNNLTPGEQVILDRYATGVTEAIALVLPYRDCSPEGIIRYFENPPRDPALE